MVEEREKTVKGNANLWEWFGSLWDVSVCFFIGVCRLLGRLVGSLWYMSVCFYGCVSVAAEIGR